MNVTKTSLRVCVCVCVRVNMWTVRNAFMDSEIAPSVLRAHTFHGLDCLQLVLRVCALARSVHKLQSAETVNVIKVRAKLTHFTR